MGVPPGNRPAVPRDWFRGVPERYVAGADTRGRQEGWPYPWSKQVIHEISGLGNALRLALLLPFSAILIYAFSVLFLRILSTSSGGLFARMSLNWVR